MVTFLLSDEVTVVLAGRRATVMTARTGADYVEVVNTKSRFPERRAMTVFTKIRGVQMID